MAPIMKLSPLRTSLLASLVVAAAACSAPAEDEPAAESAEDALSANDEQSFEAYDATDDELAAAHEPPGSTSSLTLYAIPAPRLIGLSWRRPGGLARRTLINEGLGLSRALGHAAVRVECGAGAGRPAEHFMGSVVDTGDDFRKMVLEEKAGLGVLLRTVPGALEDEAKLQATIDERTKNGRMSFIRFDVSDETCHALVDYARAFEQAKVASRYGFVRPLYREGAGCSAFSMAFLELARLDEPRFREAWSFDVRIPMSLVGGADNPGNRVTVLELFTTFRPWASPEEPHRRLVGWDPTKMYTSIRGWAKDGLESGGVTVAKHGRALGLVLDRRSVPPRAELANRTFWAGNPGAPRDFWGFGDP
jgi:hypothetical protein